MIGDRQQVGWQLSTEYTAIANKVVGDRHTIYETRFLHHNNHLFQAFIIVSNITTIGFDGAVGSTFWRCA